MLGARLVPAAKVMGEGHMKEFGDLLARHEIRAYFEMCLYVGLLGIGVGMYRAGLVEHADEVITASITAIFVKSRSV